ncbi:mannitol dehydrogenase family protein [Butyricicoccus porcorum]|uniref:Mannitol dehydrogenase n=1 Tax=Butyricicoccus porcorum TaxID=1945634 RepID=A0A252F3J9_9FIRM|nr:mannitol dehydrogenase family protein [Butyricicoccus porcorum]MCI6925647.1 mannitol dehydrogenase family protein [Butyricicoccus porcorum]MDD6986548.1 mannitol dehydrogenase family protein [Butyricicoccus porcorum]MDY4482531.1 mannitol dehydrogenase family protein [Butyricicoccus porcorum]OUM20368.1 mannitol dehydrogenase [Butyricicoccus porcorum]
MKLSLENLEKKVNWKGYRLPDYDIADMRAKTKAEPTWLHIGAGNIFRAFPAVLAQRMLTAGLTDKGIICCEAYDEEIIDKAFRPFDNLSICVTLYADGALKKEVVGSIAESLKMSAEFDRVREIFCNPSLQMVSLTITEKAYILRGPDRNYLPDVQADMENGPVGCRSFMGKLACLCLRRMHACGTPIALVSMDNCSNNGYRLQRAMFEIINSWFQHGKIDAMEFSYLTGQVSYPRTMIDKITPFPSSKIATVLRKDGLDLVKPAKTEKGSWVSCFVNTESPQYLLMEDLFPNGHPPLEQLGIIFTSGRIVEKSMEMKACSTLNPMDTAMAEFGMLLGYETINCIVHDDDIRTFITNLSHVECMPLGADPGVLDPDEFVHEILTVRYPNPYLNDTAARIMTDTSQKVGTRYGQILSNYYNSPVPMHRVSHLRFIPLAIAGWLRYLLGVDDNGEPMQLSPDPLMESLRGKLEGITLGSTATYEQLYPILSDRTLFGVNLFEIGCGDRVIEYFNELIAGPGAVRATLHKRCNDKDTDLLI